MKSIQAASQIEFEEATSYRRLAARVIDLGIAWFVLLILSGLLSGLILTIIGVKSFDDQGWSFAATFLLLLVAYDTIMHKLWGKTVGKFLLGLRVVDANGELLDWKMSLVRAVLLYLSGIAIGFLTAITASIFGWIFISGLSRYKRFFHDTASKAYVVRESKGQLVKAEAHPPTPLDDLERLKSQGIITAEEYERKRKETK